jgi:hypothetical protein
MNAVLQSREESEPIWHIQSQFRLSSVARLSKHNHSIGERMVEVLLQISIFLS